MVCEINSAICLPESKDYQIKVSVGELNFIARKVV
jgi:hypothetical protein